ncbi:carbohydrate kinase family protein [Steroidobacter sp. S1-65]|uniref:Carbohydrate kinase family protein n=1 Tax=Steroidobacter gossypii TaxID=2805490 RepID=A0ABS1WVL9_9GAMM|nr:carbohydrate kinase family protein [Steroidobacter gossypii]MBM0105009.1 carbohydrate kinase family protein [Steroidobacter gossypii]
MRKLAVVSGYATVDYPVRLAAPLSGAQTATVEALGRDGWPRPGGAALYASLRLAAAGHRAKAFVGLGDDANGALYLSACGAGNVEVEAFACDSQTHTPWCMLLYHDDGSYTCLLDRGEMDGGSLTQAQRQVLAHTDLVCIAAGPATRTAALLDNISARSIVAWIAKRDSVSYPQWLNERLAQRADLIFCNTSERAMVDSARLGDTRAGQWIIETRGADGVVLEGNSSRIELSSAAVRVRDATGAGDTFAGEVLAALLAGSSDIEAAARRGIDAARALLLTRAY